MQQDTPSMWLIINKLSATLNYHNLLSALIGNSSYIKKRMPFLTILAISAVESCCFYLRNSAL